MQKTTDDVRMTIVGLLRFVFDKSEEGRNKAGTVMVELSCEVDKKLILATLTNNASIMYYQDKVDIDKVYYILHESSVIITMLPKTEIVSSYQETLERLYALRRLGWVLHYYPDEPCLDHDTFKHHVETRSRSDDISMGGEVEHIINYDSSGYRYYRTLLKGREEG